MPSALVFSHRSLRQHIVENSLYKFMERSPTVGHAGNCVASPIMDCSFSGQYDMWIIQPWCNEAPLVVASLSSTSSLEQGKVKLEGYRYDLLHLSHADITLSSSSALQHESYAIPLSPYLSTKHLNQSQHYPGRYFSSVQKVQCLRYNTGGGFLHWLQCIIILYHPNGSVELVHLTAIEAHVYSSVLSLNKLRWRFALLEMIEENGESVNSITFFWIFNYWLCKFFGKNVNENKNQLL